MRLPLLLSGTLRNLLVVGTWLLSVGLFFLVLSAGGPPWMKDWALPLALLCAFGSSWLGWAVRQAWIYPHRLRRAEALWASGGYASEVVDLLAGIHLATGELGYRVWLLREKANLALGFRNLAWVESEEAHLARTPFWLRSFLRRYLHSAPGRFRAGAVWLRLAPRMPRLNWVLAIHLLRQDNPQDRDRAWDLLLGAMPHAADDPLLLEDLMLALLGRLEDPGPDLDRGIDYQAAFERVLQLLLGRHGCPRLGWDRVPPALHLLKRNRYTEVLALGHSLPVELYSETLWVIMLTARKGLGDLEGAWQVAEEALAAQPGSFRLWMMRANLALELDRSPEALDALERAHGVIAREASEEQQREWHTRRAEYAYWVEDDPEGASQHLEYLSAAAAAEGRPPLRLLILLDLGRYDDVHREVAPLLETQPDDPDLQLILAESLAGMQAWDSLRVHLDTLGEPARRRSDFWHLRGICRSHLGDLVLAREDLERSAQMEPDSLRMLLDAGHASADLGDWERSEFHWRQVLRQDECNEEALTQLAEARRTLHDINGAKRLLRECLLHHPDSRSAQVMLAELDAN